MKIGVVGYSSNQIDEAEVAKLLLLAFRQVMFSHPEVKPEIVTGLTNIGVPKVAYQLADQYGWHKVGLSAQAAFRVKCGVYPVDQQIIIGEQFGDESTFFVDYIDYLVRVGGGRQSHAEVALFKQRSQSLGWDLSKRLIEFELALTTQDKR